jgi:hypothetical protein
MRSIILYFLFFFPFLTGMEKDLNESSDTSQVLEKLYSRLANNFDDKVKIRINDSIRVIIDSYIASDTVFNHRFNNLRYLGQITSPDSMLKIITWNLVLKNDTSLYFCYLIKKQESGMKNKIYRLSTKYREETVRTDTIYTNND